MSQSPISIESFRAATPNPWKPWLIASVAALAILGIALGLMLLFGLFHAAKDDTGAKTLAASLGVVGAVLSAVVTLIGIVVKYSIDERNAQLAVVESGRNFWLAVEAEKRNRIDAAIRAVGLLGENNQNTTEHQIGGALLALVSLGELELAVSLLANLWPANLASIYVAGFIMQTALKEGSDAIKNTAAVVLTQNVERIAQDGFNMWPIPPLEWRMDLPDNCRIGLVIAACEWLIVELENDPDYLPDVAMVLHGALADTTVADYAAACLRPLLVFPPDYAIGTGTHVLSVAEIMESLEASPDEPETYEAAAYQERVEAALAGREEEPPQSDLGSTD